MLLVFFSPQDDHAEIINKWVIEFLGCTITRAEDHRTCHSVNDHRTFPYARI